MDILDELFDSHAKSRPVWPYFAEARYGFTWETSEGIILYGTGAVMAVLALSIKRTLPCLPFALCGDAAEQEKQIHGVPVERIEAAAARHPRALLVFCDERETMETSLAATAPRIPERLATRAVHYRQLGDFLPLGDRLSKAFDLYRKNHLASSPRNRLKVKSAYALCGDSLSRLLFVSSLRRYLFGSDAAIPVSTDSPQYFADLYTRRQGEIFVDCGACSGDTLDVYLRLLPNEVRQFHEYIAFEPDPAMFAVLGRYIAALPVELRDRVTAYPFAAGSEKGKFLFEALGDGSSVISQKGDTLVQCVSLDEALADKAPTLIKMDIEGYEAFAVYGAREIIARCRPVLAICIYHHLFDLWEIPLLLQRLARGYHYFLRAYHPYFEYVCYAVPHERLSGKGAELLRREG
ncbi:MAG: FkbM family methyltransferase [Deltaproteobacteria bacterium]|jgi:FkbM family methyltransferase|nr:FkbM family methyltransferase [Deltaproteobacteria bacterium]